MARKLFVVLSQSQSANPVKRKLEEDLVAALLMERGIEVTVVPHLYDLKPDGTGMLALRNIPGDIVLLSWLFPRAAFWTLDRNGIRGHEGISQLAEEPDEDDETEAEAAEEKARVAQTRPKPNRRIYCIDLRSRNEPQPFVEEIRRIHQECSAELNSLTQWLDGLPKPEHLARLANPTNTTSGVDAEGRLNGSLPTLPVVSAAPAEPATEPLRIAEEPGRRWYPVIDYSRCTNCLECIDFCLFGVYGIDTAETILVEQPDNCRKGCPACSRVCPENAIIFPQHKSPAIAGSMSESAGSLKIDLSKLFGAPDGIDQAVRERDVELVAAGREAVGKTVGIPKRQSQKDTGPKDELDALIDQLDELEL